MSRYLCPPLVLALFLVTAVAQTPTWSVELIGGQLAGANGPVFAVGVNDDGVIVGNTSVNGFRRGWVGSVAQGLAYLPMPATATWSEVYDLNEFGVIVGRVLDASSQSRAIIWTPTPTGYQFMLLPMAANNALPFDARAINDFGDVVGKLGILSGSYHWSATTGVTQIPTSVFPVVPEAINNERQIVADVYRMDLDTMLLENLGNPVGTGFNYIFSVLWRINEAGDCGGYANTATSQLQSKQAVRFQDGPIWTAFNSIPVSSANVMGIAESGDTAFQLGTFGRYLHVEGYGSIALQNLPGPAWSDWNLASSFAPVVSRGGLLAANGSNATTGQAGIVLLRPADFVDLGGASLARRGHPVLTTYGNLTPGSPARFRLAAAAPSSWTYYLVATNPTPVSIFGGTLFAYPWISTETVLTDAAGRHDATVPWPLVAPGTPFVVQAVIVQNGSFDFVLSNAILTITR